MKVKIITGYKQDQYEVIDAEEAHKAYYLFLNPDKRGVFSNGVALRGQDIHRIVPAWNETMGWNPTHNLDSDDWNEIRDRGIDRKLQHTLLPAAREIAVLANPEDMNKPLSLLVKEYPQALPTSTIHNRGSSIGVLLKDRNP